MKLSNRDTALIQKTARYYLQYKRVDTISRLKKVLGDVEKINLDDAQRTIASYLAYSASRIVNRSILLALRDMWVKREFTVQVGDDVVGAIDVARSIPYYPFHYASLLPNLKMDELSYLSYIARKVLKLAKDRLNDSRVAPFSFFQEMRKEIRKLEERKELLPAPSIPQISDSSPEWLRNAYFAYIIAKRASAGISPIKEGEKKERGVKLILSKLYELFVYMLVARTLEELGFSLKIEEGMIKVKEADIVILFNTPIKDYDIVERVDEYDINAEINFRIKGRPDISIRYDNASLILIECKYSEDPGYITEGRFKVMAYTYEYGATASFLVFPGLGEGGQSDEEEGTIELYRQMGEKGWVDIRLRDGRKIYMVKIDPLEDTKTLMDRIKPILLPMLKIDINLE
ncbi:MAG: hypothetical protein OWQ54_09240 [Sulfolobaceae archaeon]|nr:hypothetical protein [Sulfolobaceae archaeon]